MISETKIIDLAKKIDPECWEEFDTLVKKYKQTILARQAASKQKATVKLKKIPDIHLVAMQPIHEYQKGDQIYDPHKINRILDINQYAGYFVRVISNNNYVEDYVPDEEPNNTSPLAS